MGFCLFNTIALAVDHAKRAHGLTRILIVDWDVHHGNGTQDIFYEDPNVLFFSVHRYGHGFYPGTGAENETGRGRGLGHIFNAAIRYGTSRKDYHAKFTSVLEKASDKIKPELVLISAGFDAHAKDPIGSLGLDVDDFVTLTTQVLDVAKTHAKGRLVSHEPARHDTKRRQVHSGLHGRNEHAYGKSGGHETSRAAERRPRPAANRPGTGRTAMPAGEGWRIADRRTVLALR
jgi:hypothetical protein